jgi:hypothetical protein
MMFGQDRVCKPVRSGFKNNKYLGEDIMRAKLSLPIILILTVTGCTGTQVKLSHEPITQSSNQAYNSVGVRDVPAIKSLPLAGNLTEAFSNEIRTSGFAKDVYYPVRPDDKVDIVLDSQFSAEVDTHSGSMFAKAFFTGFTLFLLEPVFWYDIDYKLAGNVNVLKDGKLVKQATAATDATISAKWLSLSKLPALEAEALYKAKKSLFQQLMQAIGK